MNTCTDCRRPVGAGFVRCPDCRRAMAAEVAPDDAARYLDAPPTCSECGEQLTRPGALERCRGNHERGTDR